jgi:hypothetical protein
MIHRACLLLLTLVFVFFCGVLHAQPLPSWNDGRSKQQILKFVSDVTTQGSPAEVQYGLVDGKPALTRLPKIAFIDDGPGKPVGIYRAIGSSSTRPRTARSRIAGPSST